MRLASLAVVVLAALSGCGGDAPPPDPLVGTFDRTCGETPCHVTVTKNGDVYDVAFVAGVNGEVKCGLGFRGVASNGVISGMPVQTTSTHTVRTTSGGVAYSGDPLYCVDTPPAGDYVRRKEG